MTHYYSYFAMAAGLLGGLALSAPLNAQINVDQVFSETISSNNQIITSLVTDSTGRFFATRRNGEMLIFDDFDSPPETFMDLRGPVVSSGSEQGLLSMVFHPNDDDVFFVYYTEGTLNNADSVIARYFRDSLNPERGDAFTEARLLDFDQDFSNHNGGMLRFGPDGYLYAGMGDGGSGNDPNCRAQEMDTLLGKMIRLDVDQNFLQPPFHGIPGDNPFTAQGEPMNKVWALGLRNPWRFTFDQQTGDMWIADVGQNAQEEINFQPASSTGGINYGWKVMEGDLCVDQFFLGGCSVTLDVCNSMNFVDPVATYNHSERDTDNVQRQSITGGFVYRGSQAPELFGKYVFGDYLTGEIFSYDPMTDDLAPFFDRDGFAQGPITFGEGPGGDLYVVYSGAIFRISQDISSADSWNVY